MKDKDQEKKRMRRMRKIKKAQHPDIEHHFIHLISFFIFISPATIQHIPTKKNRAMSDLA